VIAVVLGDGCRPPQPLAPTTAAATATAATNLGIALSVARPPRRYPVTVSVVGVVLLAAAVVLLAAAEWSRLSRRFGVDGRKRRERARRKSQLRVVRDESDEFVRDVERDLAALPTIDPRDAKKR
jgi:hypothetical protein